MSEISEALKKGAFIISSILVITVALRNSLIWHLEEVWGASGTFWSSVWAFIYKAYGENDFLVWVVGTELNTIIVFVLSNFFFAFIDFTGQPSFLLKYKIEEDRNIPVDWEKYKKAMKRVAFNVVVVGSGFNILNYNLVKWRGSPCGYELPYFSTSILHVVAYLIIIEIGFYYSHRLCHHPLLYKHIHKTHHEWNAPVSITSIYCHPLEHLCVNIVPVALGPLVMGSHISMLWLWSSVAVINTTIVHSGYHFPFLPSPESHDFHHLKFNQNYGTLGILDRLHGTDLLFRRHKTYQRHILLLGLTPVNQLVPDEPKGKGKGKAD